MTLNEIAYIIKNIVEGGISGDDSNLSIAQIRHMIHYHRAGLLTKYTDSGRFVSDAMTEVASSTNTGGTVNVPRILGWPNNRALVSAWLSEDVAGVNKIYNLQIVGIEERDFFLSTRFAPNQNHYFAEYLPTMNTVRILTSDGSVYSNASQTIYVKAVFEKPTASAYPIPAELIDSLVETVLAKEFGIYLRTTSDNSNNSVDESRGQPVAKPVAASPNANARSRRGRTR